MVFNSALLVREDFLEEVISELRQKKAWFLQGTERGSERLGRREEAKGTSALIKGGETHAS